MAARRATIPRLRDPYGALAPHDSFTPSHAWNLSSCLAAADRPCPTATFYLFTPSSFPRIIVRSVHSAMMGSL